MLTERLFDSTVKPTVKQHAGTRELQDLPPEFFDS